MSEAPIQVNAGLESQLVMPVRRLNNYVYCPRLFYFQWVENVFQESADTVAGSHVHRNVDAPSRLDDPKELGLPEGAKLRRHLAHQSRRTWPGRFHSQRERDFLE
jgi:hypothetical protein